MSHGNTLEFALDVGTVTRSIDANIAHAYRFSLDAGDTLSIEIRQIGVDLVVSSALSDGTTTVTDAPGERNASEFVQITAKVAGAHSLVVRPKFSWWPTGQYQITAIKNDTPVGHAELATASQEFRTRNKEQLRDAADSLEALLASNNAAPERYLAMAAFFLGDVYRTQKQYDQSIARYLTAQTKFAEIDDAEMALAAKRGRAFSLVSQSRYDDALALYNVILSEFADVPPTTSPSDQLMVRSNICWTINAANRIFSGRACLQPLAEEVADYFDAEIRGLVNNNLGHSLLNLGEARLAIEHFEQALAAYRTLPDYDKMRTTHINMGHAYRILGDIAKAFEHYHLAVGLQAIYADNLRHAQALNNLGQLYATLGDYQQARVYFEDALERRKIRKESKAYRSTLNNLATAQRYLNLPDAALENRLTLVRTPADRLEAMELPIYLMGLAHDYLSADRLDELATLDERLAAVDAKAQPRQSGEIDRTRAKIAARLGQFEQAFTLAKSAESQFDEIEYVPGQFNIKLQLARLHLNRGNLENAIDKGREAIALAEDLRGQIQLKSIAPHVSATTHDAYIVVARSMLAMSRKNDVPNVEEQALSVIQSMKSRALGAYRLAQAELFDALTAEDYELLLEKRAQASAFSSALSKLRAKPAAGSVLRELKIQYDAAIEEIEQIEAKIAAKSNGARKEKTGFSLSELQAQLRPGDVLLEYVLAEDTSYVWRVTPEEMRVVTLPGRQTLAPLLTEVAQGLREAGKTNLTTLQALSDAILAPVLKGLTPQRVLVSSHRETGQVPMSVLDARAEPSQYLPLMATTEVLNIPSANIWLKEAQAPAHDARYSIDMVTFSDAIFERTDDRVTKNSTRPGERNPTPTAGSDNSAQLKRLRWSREEARYAAGAFAEARVRNYWGPHATLENALQAELAGTRRLHIASHGVTDNLRPDVPGMILSRWTTGGEPINGSLTVGEILRSPLRPEQVVLSGCETAIGPLRTGEGMQGLANAFLKKGARTVIASHWPIQEKQNSELMRVFYELQAEGQSGTASLRAAQQALFSKPETKDPHYWGGFVNYGW